MAQYTHQKHSCMAFAFGNMKIYLRTFHFSRAHLLFFFSFEFLFIFFAPLALDDKYIFIFPFSFDVFPSFDLNILDKRRRRKTIFFIPIIYARTHTRYVCFMKYFLEKATLVSHVLSSSFEIYKTCFSSFGSPIWTKKKF
jgi:hypothetical protein